MLLAYSSSSLISKENLKFYPDLNLKDKKVWDTLPTVIRDVESGWINGDSGEFNGIDLGTVTEGAFKKALTDLKRFFDKYILEHTSRIYPGDIKLYESNKLWDAPLELTGWNLQNAINLLLDVLERRENYYTDEHSKQIRVAFERLGRVFTDNPKLKKLWV